MIERFEPNGQTTEFKIKACNKNRFHNKQLPITNYMRNILAVTMPLRNFTDIYTPFENIDTILNELGSLERLGSEIKLISSALYPTILKTIF